MLCIVALDLNLSKKEYYCYKGRATIMDPATGTAISIFVVGVLLFRRYIGRRRIK